MPPTLTLVLIGDSTVATYPPADPLCGWGQLLPEFFTPETKILNLAEPGRSTKTYLPLWPQALQARADFIFIQFGHNDSHAPDRPESTRADGEYRDHLRHYAREARATGAVPIFVTPMHRRTFHPDGTLTQELLPYAQAMQVVAAELEVPVIDLHTASGHLFAPLGDEGSTDLTAPNDRTHFTEKGARLMAQLVAQAASTCDPRLRANLK